MAYVLKRLVLGSASYVSITHDEYCQIEWAKMILREAHSFEQKFDFTVENYIEFEEEINKICIRNMVLGRKNYQWFSENRAVLDRRVMNFMTTAVSYTDSVPHHLNNIFSRDKTILKSVSKLYSDEYDSKLGYRSICKLRNFVQHQGLPVHGTVYHSKWMEKGNQVKGQNRYTVDPYLRPQELKEGKFNKSVLAELEAMGEKVDLKLLLREYVEGLSNAHVGTRQKIAESIVRANNIFELAFSSFQTAFPDESTTIGLSAAKTLEFGVYTDAILINREPNEFRESLERKNPKLTNLIKRYVSSEIVDD